jgi:cardiolipin synthase
MLDGIARATATICFETYIGSRGEVAERFSSALAAKAREGLKVHVLIDGMGCAIRGRPRGLTQMG